MSGSRGEVVGMFPNGSNGVPVGVIPFRGSDSHEIRSSAVLDHARKSKGEHLLPFATRESERADARLYVEAMPQVPCKVTGFYVSGETFETETPEIVLPGQYARLEIPENVTKKIIASDFTKSDLAEIACGVLASVDREVLARNGISGLQWKLPIGARVVKEQVASTLTIPPGTTVIVQWQPEVASRFKRFAAEIVGDKDALLLNDFRIGKDSLFLSSASVPFAVVTMPGAFEVPDIIVPGIIVTVSLSNRSNEEVTLGGGIVFENVEDELLALQKKYEEEMRKRLEASDDHLRAKAATSQVSQAEAFGEGTK